MDISIQDLEIIFKRVCGRCQYSWLPRSKNPKRCPKCQAWIWSEDQKEGDWAPEEQTT